MKRKQEKNISNFVRSAKPRAAKSGNWFNLLTGYKAMTDHYTHTVNTHVLPNGDKLYWIGDSMIKVTDRGYVCYQSNRHCFKRGTHEKMIKMLGIEQMNNLTFEEFYFHRKGGISK